MCARRRFFANEISTLINNLLMENPDLNFLNVIAKGDISLLPAPETYKSYMPALYIDIEDIYDNVTVNKSISATEYNFTLLYLKYFERDRAYDIKEEAITEAQLIADTLMEDMDLNTATIESGRILATRTPHISFENEFTDMFSNLKIPVIASIINYQVYFRSTIK